MRIRIFGTASVSVILTVCLLNVPFLRAADPPPGESVAKVLFELQNEAIQIRNYAAIMESYTWSDLTVESRCVVIDSMRDRVDAVRRQVAQLVEVERATASPWQKTTIDRVAPLLDELVSETQAVIDQLGRPGGLRKFREHRELLAANVHQAIDLAASISGYVDLAGRTSGSAKDDRGPAESTAVK